MTIPFGFAIAALLRGRLGQSFLRPLRASLLLPWIFLTIAIMLGGWWAYEVLGWGGYWAWDPVENASLLPWLTATAALHSAIVMERRGVLKGWTVTLVQASFLLTILGTFMTRSGVFNSVHSFTQSSIGPTILIFLAAVLVFSVVLLSFRIDSLEAEGKLDSAVSREGMFLVNNLFFVVLTFTVLVGTCFPLIVEAVKGKQMSVGRPYFDAMVVPVGTALLFLLGVGPALPWGKASKKEIQSSLLPPLITGAIVMAIGLALGVRNVWTVLTLLFGGYAAHVTMAQMWLPFRQRVKRGDAIGPALVDAQLRRGRRRFGGYIVHAGAVIVFVAIAVSSTMRTQQEVTLTRGQSTTFAGYTVTYLGSEERTEPHRQSTIARFNLTKGGPPSGGNSGGGGNIITTMEPRMNQYAAMREPIGTPAVYSTITRDYYISIMNLQGDSAGVLIINMPMVGWIWGSVIMMGIGGLIALIPSRRRTYVVAPVAADAGSGDEVPA
jgi:cytochrome c-type biogenesis protein CcmF